MGRRRGWVGRLLIALGIVLGLFGGVFAWAYLSTSRSLLARMIVWRDADVWDYQKFPAREVENAPPVFSFAAAPSPNPYGAALEAHTVTTADGKTRPLPDFLEATGTAAFLVIQDGRLVYESYLNGYSRESTVTSFSVAKSFVSALVGVAISEDLIESVDTPVTRYLPELRAADPRFSRVTIRHLLTMASGLRYETFDTPNPFRELRDDDTLTYYAPDLRALALSAQVEGVPGRVFEYNNYHPLLLGLVLERVTGERVADYLSEKLWGPLGAEAPATWSLDAYGFEKMESGINGRAVDFAKFGLLYLNRGVWRGRQLVPSAWVDASTGVGRGPADFYGYFWWLTPQADGPPHPSARGNKGQFLYLIPEKRLLFVRFGTEFGYDRWPELFEALATLPE